MKRENALQATKLRNKIEKSHFQVQIQKIKKKIVNQKSQILQQNNC